MSEMIRRPGGEMAKRPLNFFWVVDCSGSMSVENKMQQVNYAIQSTIPDMREAAKDNTNAQLYVQAMQFSTGATWLTTQPEEIETYQWRDMTASGVTDLGKAFELLCGQLSIPPMSDRALPPVIVLLSDGQPTDSYRSQLDQLLNMPWGKKAVRIAIAIGRDADRSVLEEFTGNKELVLDANNPQALVAMIKWASTVAKQVSTPASRRANVETSTPSGAPSSVQTGPVTIDLAVPDDFGDDVW
ncbi:vWA domain-containing protein [Butyrivibrio sp. AE3004]|uniref:vWA domain-containing protein n=1 Tax=Butyrivibrio sp. AE3004 TaxID=1506994 RepID=UPI000494CCD3|nr:VWA domain-containing protein [Butyrivibrio sp. AE3004]